MAWQRCQDLAMAVYGATKNFPKEERYGLVSQLRRASVSGSSNIAEGYGRHSGKELVRFLWIALGSLSEVDSLLALSEKLGLLTPEEASHLGEVHRSASQLTYALMKNPGR